jgi:short chain dehydrogenase
LATVIGRRLTTEGCDLVIAARTAVDLENEATRLRTDTGRRVEVEAVDLSDGDQVIALAQGHGDVDVLIDNAGALPGGQVLDIDEATWRKATYSSAIDRIGGQRLRGHKLGKTSSTSSSMPTKRSQHPPENLPDIPAYDFRAMLASDRHSGRNRGFTQFEFWV